MNLYRLPLLILALLFLAHTTHALPKFWPLPQKLTINTKATPLQISPCDVRYLITSPIPVLMQTVNHYLQNVFKCTSQGQSNITLNINVAGSSINLPLETSQEAYSLFIRQNGRWQLTAEQYSGFLRGLQTYSQIFQQDQNNKFFVEGIPIGIDDKPEYKWRGILLDSSRHFLPIASIKKQIDAMLYNKMNVLHWHIIDQDSFPYEVESVPELSQYGKLSGTYSKKEISQLISYAILRGVRIVVELDSPAHTDAWGRSEKYKDIVVKCNNKYQGQFDPTIDLTYDVVRSVFNQANQLFDDPYIHFGGDEVDLNCWNKKPSIKQWMNNNNISTYKQLQILYRTKQKTLYRTISSTKKVIYWANEEIDLPVQDDDVVQWWGQTKNLKNLVNRPNEVILSNYDETYLDVGFGSRNGGNYLTYIKWRDIYKFEPKFTGVNIIGGEVCMWGELSNQRTNEQKIWNRASILAQRLWNSRIVLATNLNDIATRLVAHSRRLNKRGIKTSPVTVQICEQNMSICF